MTMQGTSANPIAPRDLDSALGVAMNNLAVAVAELSGLADRLDAKLAPVTQPRESGKLDGPQPSVPMAVASPCSVTVSQLRHIQSLIEGHMTRVADTLAYCDL